MFVTTRSFTEMQGGAIIRPRHFYMPPLRSPVIMTEVKFFANFREIVGQRSINIDAGGKTVGWLIDHLVDKYEGLGPALFEDDELREYVHVMVNGRSIHFLDGLDTVLQADDELAIFPPVAGG